MPRPTILDDILPADLGLPETFPCFRQVQREMADYAIYGPEGEGEVKAITALGAPAGSGKTLASEAIGILAHTRIATLTATKSLMDQRQKEFVVADVRGRNNYICIEEHKNRAGERVEVSCEVGSEEGCDAEGTADCPYYAKVEEANHARSISTNYQYWMNARRYNQLALEGSGQIGLLICDEAHLIPEALSQFMSTWLRLEDINKFSNTEDTGAGAPWHGVGDQWGRVGEQWLKMLQGMQGNLAAAKTERIAEIYDKLRDGNPYWDEEAIKRAAKRLIARDRHLRQWDKLAKELWKLVQHGGDGNWVWQLGVKGVRFDVVWPARYAERYLFSGVKKVVLMSATLRPKLLTLLGLERGRVDFKEWPRQFRADYAPVYHLPTVKMNWRTTQVELQKMVDRVDELITARPGRRVLVHTHSYDRAKYLQAHSKYGRDMILNSSDAGIGRGLTAQEAADAFRAKVPTPQHPAILVGPSFTTGWDFIGVECELNIIVKIPWPDLSSPIMKARAEDEEYSPYVTMQDLVQACGRAQRHETDRCETFVLDDGIQNFQYFAKQHAPQWFKVIKIGAIPPEPVKL